MRLNRVREKKGKWGRMLKPFDRFTLIGDDDRHTSCGERHLHKTRGLGLCDRWVMGHVSHIMASSTAIAMLVAVSAKYAFFSIFHPICPVSSCTASTWLSS